MSSFFPTTIDRVLIWLHPQGFSVAHCWAESWIMLIESWKGKWPMRDLTESRLCHMASNCLPFEAQGERSIRIKISVMWGSRRKSSYSLKTLPLCSWSWRELLLDLTVVWLSFELIPSRPRERWFLMSEIPLPSSNCFFFRAKDGNIFL